MTSRTFARPQSALEARFEAQRIAFAPVVFQCVRIATRWGLLEQLDRQPDGLEVAELARSADVSEYAVRVVLESCLSAGVVSLQDDRYHLEKVGHFFVRDRLTRINLEFNHEVCYRGLAELENSLRAGKPLGLATLGPWETIYQGLAQLPPAARKAWFDFDHHYSDSAFDAALHWLFRQPPRRLLDIGANTGRFAGRCLARDPGVRVTLADLPAQLALADAELAAHRGRYHLHPIDLLDDSASFPGDHDTIWMSQFLSCFSLAGITSILTRARRALPTDGRILILDTFWDRQAHDIAAYCVINTSPYFSALANGHSKMYESRDYVACAGAAGLALVDIRDGIGLSHSLLTFAASP